MGLERFLFGSSVEYRAMRLFIGFIFHKISFGLLSVLLPLYITQAISGGNC